MLSDWKRRGVRTVAGIAAARAMKKPRMTVKNFIVG